VREKTVGQGAGARGKKGKAVVVGENRGKRIEKDLR